MLPNYRERPVYGVLIMALFALGCVFLFALSVFLFQKTYLLDEAPPRERVITVTGTGKVRGTPDIAVVTAGFTVGGVDVGDVQQDANRKMNALVDAVKKEGTAAEDIRTIEFTTSPTYAYEQGKAPRITGYEVRQQIEIRIRDLKNVDAVLGAAGRAGATNIAGLQFTIDEPEALRAEARAKAIAEARGKATAIADALGVTLGRAVAFTESGGLPPIPPIPFAYEGRGGGGDYPKVEEGTSEIMADVTVTYELK